RAAISRHILGEVLQVLVVFRDDRQHPPAPTRNRARSFAGLRNQPSDGAVVTGQKQPLTGGEFLDDFSEMSFDLLNGHCLHGRCSEFLRWRHCIANSDCEASEERHVTRRIYIPTAPSRYVSWISGHAWFRLQPSSEKLASRIFSRYEG